MDWLDAGAQPRCPDDGTVLRVSDGQYRCACGHSEPLTDVERPPDDVGVIEFPSERRG